MCLYIVPNLQFLHGMRAFRLSSSKELRSYQYSTSNRIQHPLPLWRRAWIELTSIPPSLYLCMFNIASPWVQQKLSMDSSSSIIPTPFNYHEWKVKIGILFRSKGLYRVSLALENDPNAIVEKANWNNRLDEAYGFLCLSIYPGLLFSSRWFDHSKQSMVQNWDSLCSTRWDKSASIGECVILIESKQFRIHWMVIQ